VWSRLVPGLLLLSAGGAAATAVVDDCDTISRPVSVHCGTAPSTAFDRQGRLWAVFEQDGYVRVTVSDDTGRHFRPAVSVNLDPEPVWTNGENRPKIAFGPDGEIYVSWTKRTAGRFTGDVRFSRSLDGGRSFAPVKTVNDDGLLTSHRFESLFAGSDGTIYLVWLDKRDGETARAKGETYPGAALYYTVSTDRGAGFAPNRKVVDSSCECCRISIAESPEGEAAVFWRHMFEQNIRDHAFVLLGRDGARSAVQRATYDNWRIEACPHHGPSMIAAERDQYHLAWFTGAAERRGIHYGRYDASTGRLHESRRMAGSSGAGHPSINRIGNRLLMAWKEFDGRTTSIRLAVSEDAGKNWQPARVMAATTGASDHPFLLSHAGQGWLSWHSAREGLRIIPVETGKLPAGVR